MERKIDYLRLSITDRCNLNCLYCAPKNKDEFLSREDVLRYEEIIILVYAFVQLGIKKLRLTGGEPLVRKNVIELISMLKAIDGLEEISITTNGVSLKNLAASLKNAGLDRVNVSLDTLRRERFKSITGLDCFNEVWTGIEKSLQVGLSPVKLNVILMKGINDDEIIDFVRLALERPIIIRFIEFFQTNRRFHKLNGCLVNNGDVKKKIVEHFGAIKKNSHIKGNGPAEYYSIRDGKGIIGFISNASENFCHACNRIRVDCTGRVWPCLFSGHICNLRSLLRENASQSQLLEAIRNVLLLKPRFRKNQTECYGIEMSSIGG